MTDPVIGKVVVDITRSYIVLYRCDGDGTVVDEDRFRVNWRLDRREALGETNDIHGVVFDYLNDIWNGSEDEDGDDAARDDEPATD
jgi:hypothetical protein